MTPLYDSPSSMIAWKRSRFLALVVARMYTLEQARPADWGPALELAFASLPEPDRQRHIVNALALLAGGELDRRGVWIARDGDGIAGVQVVELLGGATALFWTPMVRPDCSADDLTRQLVDAALSWSRAHACKIAEALVLPQDVCRAEPICRAGFSAVTEMYSLRHDLADIEMPPARLHLVGSAKADRELFEATLLRTYEGTLDCPELNGRRSVGEILAGHRAAGKDRPELWQLAFVDNRPVGVLLLTELPHGLDWDLSYLGIVPEARRQGLGRALAQHAMQTARDGGALHLVLAVDARNEPARQLYQWLGFEVVEKRIVYLHFFAQPTAPAPAPTAAPPAAAG